MPAETLLRLARPRWRRRLRPRRLGRSIFRSLWPAMGRVAPRERLRAAVGSGLGLLCCALLVSLFHTQQDLGLFLIAPLGASAVLLFAVPNSPLAQPWSAIVGNTASAFLAVAVVLTVPQPWAAGLAVGGAIFLMIALRALHPPGGAVALLAVLEAQTVREMGFGFALAPVGLTTALLVLLAVVFNRLTGRVYPFRQPAERSDDTPAAPGQDRLGLTTDELQNLLLRFNQSTNLGVEDLGRLLAAAEMEAVAHRFDAKTCADIMTRDLVTVAPDTPLQEIAALYRRHPIKSLPVVDRDRCLLGIILQRDLIAWATREQPRHAPAGGLLPLFRRRDPRPAAGAADMMDRSIRPVPHDTPVGTLLNLLASQAVQIVPVVQGEALVGIITRTDIINLLLQGSSERRAA